jgi:hypothetical protein
MLGPIANGLSFVRNFVGPCLWVLLAGSLTGSAVGGWLAWKVQDGRVARAETALERLQHEQTKAIADAAAKNVMVTQDVLGGLYDQRRAMDAIAADIGRLRAGVSVCASVSRMQISRPAEGTGQAPGDGQPRPAEAVLQDLGAEFAKRADDNAAQLNALIEWLEQTAVPNNR